MGKTKSSVHLIRQVTGVGRDRQVMTEFINTSRKFQEPKKLAKKKKHNLGSDTENKANFLNF